MQRERAMNAQTALRSGGAARRRPNDSNRDRSRGERANDSVAMVGQGANGAVADAVQGENGPAHERRQRKAAFEWRPTLAAATSFNSVCALTLKLSCKAFS